MKKHLKVITKMIETFCKKYNLQECYINVNSSVQARNHSRVIIEGLNELDNYKLSEIKKFQCKLNDDIRVYLEKNNIEKPVYIESVPATRWGTSHINVYFKEELKVNL